MKWKELIGLVDQVFDDVAREDGAEFIICPECGEPIYEQDYKGITFVPVVSSISRKCKNFREKKKVLDKQQNLCYNKYVIKGNLVTK